MTINHSTTLSQLKATVALIAAIIICMTAQAQQTRGCTSLYGRVIGLMPVTPCDTLAIPLSHASITTDTGRGHGTLTDEAGYFMLDSLRPGKHHLIFSYVGMETLDTTVILHRQGDYQLFVRMNADASSDPQPPLLTMLVPRDKMQMTIDSRFWKQYGLRCGIYINESLADDSQRLTPTGFAYAIMSNFIIFDYLDRTFGCRWRADAPHGIIGLDATAGLDIDLCYRQR